MRKIISLLILITLLTGCSNNINDSVDKQTSSSSSEEMVTTSSTVSLEEEKSEEVSPENLMEEDGYMTPSIYDDYSGNTKISNDKNGEKLYLVGDVKDFSYADNSYVLHMSDKDSNTWILLFSPFIAYYDTRIESLVNHSICINGKYVGYSEETDFPIVKVFWEDDSRLYVLDLDNKEVDKSYFCSEQFDSVKEEYSFKIHYLSNKENAQHVYDSIEKGDFIGLYDEMEQYIADNNLEGSDANIILDRLKPFKENEDKLDFSYDNVEGKYIIYYKGLNEISKEHHVIPYFSSESDAAQLKLGFIASDWIFFDEVIAAFDGAESKDFLISTEKKNEDVLNGGNIEECALDRYVSDVMNDGHSPITIRFKNEDEEKYLDFNLTDEEKQALEIFDAISYAGSAIERIVTYCNIAEIK